MAAILKTLWNPLLTLHENGEARPRPYGRRYNVLPDGA